MARSETLLCDVCGKPTERIVAKIYFTPTIPGVQKAVHSNYSHHADVGTCCSTRVVKGLRMKKRTSAEEYRARRRGVAA